MRRAAAWSAVLVLWAVSVSAPAGAQTANLHEIKWFVHTDLVTGGMTVGDFEAILDAALEEAQIAIEGNQGPVEPVCCSKLVKEEHSPGVTLTTFGTPGDGLDVLDAGDLNTIRTLGGSGSRAFYIDSINNCGGSPAIGCADLTTCNSIPDDDPNLVLIVTQDAEDSGVLGLVIAHERGHNACLVHVASNPCELMQGSVSGGCLSAASCADYDDARQTTGGSCSCHTAGGAAETDGIPCTDGAVTGQCSGGVCGEVPGDASVQLMAAGGPGSSSGQPFADPLLVSGVSGGWTDVGGFGVEIKGLAYDGDSSTLYGVQDVVGGDDALVTIDPATGTILTTVGTVTGHPILTSLAFDPGATTAAGDDRLLALTSDGSFEDLIAIDPATAAPTSLGPLSIGASGGFQGLAYDSANDRIFTSAFAGGSIYEIDESSCGNPFFCTTSEVVTIDEPRVDSGLAYSPDSGRLYLIGSQSGGRVLYNTIDTATMTASPTSGIDPFSIGALAAIPVPEPSVLTGLSSGIALLAWLGDRRRRNR